MENNGQENGISTTAGVPLMNTLMLMKKNEFESTIPDAVTENLLRVAGCTSTEPKMIKLISLAAQTFMSVIAKDALQHYKMRGAPQSNRIKGKDGKEKLQNTLAMEDLIPSVAKHGIIVRKPPYFV